MDTPVLKKVLNLNVRDVGLCPCDRMIRHDAAAAHVGMAGEDPVLRQESHPKKVLFVCAQNRIRSVTAEKMFAGSQLYGARSRGITNDARVKLAAGDIGWADVIFVMEKNHKNRMRKRFHEEMRSKRVLCLFIEDVYELMEEALIAELRRKLTPHLILP